MAERMVYVATHAAPGHLPETSRDIMCFSTRAKARAYAAQKRREDQGTERAGYEVRITELPLEEAEAEGARVL